MSRQRKPEIKSQNRWCAIHKQTREHREYTTGKGYPSWQCVECNRVRAAEYYAANGRNEANRGSKARTMMLELAPRLCKKCFIAVPSTRQPDADEPICEECE